VPRARPACRLVALLTAAVLPAVLPATGRRGDDLVFGRSASEAFVRSTLRTHTLKARDAAELAPLTPHEARHCAASYFAAAGLTPKEAQTAMGHADIRTTLNIYAKAVPGGRAERRPSSTPSLTAPRERSSRARVARGRG
jgi:integrase